MNKVQNLVQALIRNKGCFIDDHTKKEDCVTSFAVFISSNKTEHVVALYGMSRFAINPFSLDESGTVHLTPYSVGGYVDCALGDLKHALGEYNKNDKQCRFVELYELQDDGSCTLHVL